MRMVVRLLWVHETTILWACLEVNIQSECMMYTIDVAGGGGGDTGAPVDDATSFSFNFGGADGKLRFNWLISCFFASANETNGGGGGGGGEFNFFGF